MADAAPVRPPWRGGKPFPPIGYEAAAAQMTANSRMYHGDEDEDDDEDDENVDYGGRWVDGEWVPPSAAELPGHHLSAAEMSGVIERHIKREKRKIEALAHEAKEDAKGELLAAASGQSFTTDWAKGAISAAFEAGLAQGRREQMPAPPCKSCVIRKERNRVAARESRRKKSLGEARSAVVLQKDIIKEAADFAANRALAIAAAAASASSSSSSASGAAVTAAGGGAEEEEEDLPPPPF